MTFGERVEAALCRWCRAYPWQDSVDDDGRPISTACCDDHWFAEYGDMLTPNELRATTGLRDPDHRRQREEWLAQYERAGLGPDQEPGFFTLTLPLRDDGSPDMDGLLDAVVDAYALRMSSPDDFANERSTT